MRKYFFVTILLINSVLPAFAQKPVSSAERSHEKPSIIPGIPVTAAALAQQYASNEQQADAKYLNKVLNVSGKVSSVEKNQDGELFIVLNSGNAGAGVQCAMRSPDTRAVKGQDVTIKGYCSGNSILGISLTGCIINK